MINLSESEKATILRALSLYKDTLNFTLRNRKAKRSVKGVQEFIDLYEQDLFNIERINIYLGGK